MKKFSIVLAIMVMVMFLSGVVCAEEPWVPVMDKLNEIYEIVLDTNDKVNPVPCEGAPVAKTGQTLTFAPGDDGELEIGVVSPVPRFTDNLDGTITDNLTNLLWTKDTNLYESTTWNQALLNVDSCNVGDYNDWRLPNIKELLSLVDYGQKDPTLTSDHPFTYIPGYYWSSTTAIITPDLIQIGIYVVNFKYGSASVGDKNTTYPAYTWCVRGEE